MVVVNGAIKNFTRGHRATVIVSTSVSIGYNTPWRQVRAMLLLAAARTEGVLRDPAPRVLEKKLSDFYVEYELVAHGDATVSRPIVLSRLHEQILDVFNEHGVQIMSPNFEAQPDYPVDVLGADAQAVVTGLGLGGLALKDIISNFADPADAGDH